MGTVLRSLIIAACLIAGCSLTAPDENAPAPTYITVTPEPTRTPVPTATIIAQSSATTPTPFPEGPPCAPRDDWFVYTVEQGDSLAGIALRAGTSVLAITLANCIDADTPLNAGEGVRVPIALLPPAVPTENASCIERWFFIFRAGKTEVSNACPAPVNTLDATGQDFEGGRMIRLPANPLDGQGVSTILVLFNNGFWELYPDVWDATQPANDPALMPPIGLLQPVENFGKIWREQPDVRAALGWAYTPAVPYSARIQYAQDQRAYWYLDYGTARLAVRLVESDVAPNGWEIVGEY